MTCYSCGGSGFKTCASCGGTTTCPSCSGISSLRDPLGSARPVRQTLSGLRDRGTYRTGRINCLSCGGTGSKTCISCGGRTTCPSCNGVSSLRDSFDFPEPGPF
jgi:hypothetical protein